MMHRLLRIALLILGAHHLSQAATVTWGPVGSGIQVADLLTLGSPHTALNAGGRSVTVGDNVFAAGGISLAVTGVVSNTEVLNFYYTPGTGDLGLDVVMNSHSYIEAANPNGRGQMSILDLTAGNTYLVQIIGIGDIRACCSGRTQTVDDGNGNTSGNLTRGGGDWVVGSFVADTATQLLFVEGPNDPGLSGLIVRDLGVVPEPGTALLSFSGLLWMALRRRR